MNALGGLVDFTIPRLPVSVSTAVEGNPGVVGSWIIVYARRDRDWWLMVWRGLDDYDSRIPAFSSRINTPSRGLSIHKNIKTTKV